MLHRWIPIVHSRMNFSFPLLLQLPHDSWKTYSEGQVALEWGRAQRSYIPCVNERPFCSYWCSIVTKRQRCEPGSLCFETCLYHELTRWSWKPFLLSLSPHLQYGVTIWPWLLHYTLHGAALENYAEIIADSEWCYKHASEKSQDPSCNPSGPDPKTGFGRIASLDVGLLQIIPLKEDRLVWTRVRSFSMAAHPPSFGIPSPREVHLACCLLLFRRILKTKLFKWAFTNK